MHTVRLASVGYIIPSKSASSAAQQRSHNYKLFHGGLAAERFLHKPLPLLSIFLRYSIFLLLRFLKLDVPPAFFFKTLALTSSHGIAERLQQSSLTTAALYFHPGAAIVFALRPRR